MEYSNYKKMLEIKQIENSNDVSFVGTISSEEKDSQTGAMVTKTFDIYASIEGDTIRFFNNNNELLAIKLDSNQGILPTEYFIKNFSNDGNSLNFSEKGKYLQNIMREFVYDKESSLNKFDADLDSISKESGIPKENIPSILEVNLNDKIHFKNTESKNDKNNNKINLDEEEKNKDKKSKTKTKEEKKKLEALEKQETDLNQLVDEYHTLGDILGVPEDGKLVAVESDSVENSGNKNNTRFTFLIKDKDGNYSKCDQLEQIGGVHPEATVASAKANTTNNNAKVEQEQVNSMYKIKGSTNIDYVLTAKIGSIGTVELGMGQKDITQSANDSDLIAETIPLKTSATYYASRETR